jgi:Protein of unknown function (DUF2752)
LALLAGLVGTAVHFDFPLCPMASTFGVPCPGCGLTRATLALLHGDLHAALHFHPLVWLLAPLFAVFVGGAVLELARGPYRASPLRLRGRAVNVAAALVLSLTLGVWVARFAGYFGGPAPVTSMSAWLLAGRETLTR